jgi:hypothetical protein
MAEFMKRTALGGYKPVQGGYSDPECEYVVLTKKEYDQILKEKAQTEQESWNTKYDADKKIKEIQHSADYRVSEVAKEAREAIEGMKGELAAERAESAHQRGLNANLLRIAKERANADRKLRPKKEHTGYVVLFSIERVYRYRDRDNWETVKLWETVLQTPYSVDFTEEQVRIQVRELSDGGLWLVSRLGISAYYDGEYEEMLRKSTWDGKQKKEYNIMLKNHLKANYRSGYWEILFCHTKPLGIVPQNMRMRQW